MVTQPIPKPNLTNMPKRSSVSRARSWAAPIRIARTTVATPMVTVVASIEIVDGGRLNDARIRQLVDRAPRQQPPPPLELRLAELIRGQSVMLGDRRRSSDHGKARGGGGRAPPYLEHIGDADKLILGTNWRR